MRLAAPAPPDVDLPTAARRAAELRLGLELHASRDARSATATNLLFTDPAKVRSILTDASATAAAVWASVPVASDGVLVAELSRIVDAAATAGFAVVRLVESRPTPHAVLRAACRTAAAAGVHLAVDIPPVPNGIAAAWHRADNVDHSSLGCCLDTAHVAAAGETPSLAIPTLARRLAHVRLRHPPTDAETVHRLAGIGYAGWLSVDPAHADAVRAVLPKSK